jgi:diguanylate cyclase (GGDEF)-like protein
MPTTLMNSILLLAQAAVYFSVLAFFFRLRKRTGIGLFVCALGVMHFLETYLASVFYVELPFGIISPGSTVLFSGKLVALLLLYMREDAVAVRQPIYGLLVGNFLMVGLVLFLRMHEVVSLRPDRAPDIAFIDEMGWLMVWSTALLYVDAIAIILLYEKLGRWLRQAPLARVAVASCAVLTFDQAGFFLALHAITGAPFKVFLGGWVAKMAAGLVYSVMLVAYLRWFEGLIVPSGRTLPDVFDILTYREKYEAVLERSDRDGLTGLFHRGRFETVGSAVIAERGRSGRPISLLVIDVDHFKAINDNHGHAAGDEALKDLARLLAECSPDKDMAFRMGGEEFAILCRLPHRVACLLGEQIRHHVAVSSRQRDIALTVSIGIATADATASGLADLYKLADSRLYTAKTRGRDRVVGQDTEPDLQPKAAAAGR